MKKTLALLILAAVALLAGGCRSFPNLACDSWHHEGNYGPVTTQYDAKNVRRQEDGSLRVETYSGNIKVLGGYGVTDTVQGLVLSPAQAKKPAPVESVATPEKTP